MRLPSLLAAVFVLAASTVGAASGKEGGEYRPRGPITVTSRTMEAYKDKGLIVFKGEVVAREEFVLCSDELHLYADENREIKEIVALGNVKVVEGDKTAVGRKAVYDGVKRVIVLTGEPEVRQCANVITGDRITIYLDDENAVVESERDGRVRAVITPEGGECADKTPPPDADDRALCGFGR